MPPGSGTRIGIDRDRDTLPNAVETNTGVFVDQSDTGTSPFAMDTDGDGFDDDVEVTFGSDPNDQFDTPSGVGAPALGFFGMVILASMVVLFGSRQLGRRRAV